MWVFLAFVSIAKPRLNMTKSTAWLELEKVRKTISLSKRIHITPFVTEFVTSWQLSKLLLATAWEPPGKIASRFTLRRFCEMSVMTGRNGTNATMHEDKKREKEKLGKKLKKKSKVHNIILHMLHHFHARVTACDTCMNPMLSTSLFSFFFRFSLIRQYCG